MSKVTIGFDFDEERTELLNSLLGPDYALGVWNLDQRLRHLTKHQNQSHMSVDMVRDWIREEFDELPWQR